MTLNSMTGFGAGRAKRGGIAVDAELSSVNRKQLDVRLSLPRNLAEFEAELSADIRQSFNRGYISGHIRISMSDKARQGRIRLDRAAAKAWVKELRAAATEFDLEDNLKLSHLAGIPGLVEEVPLEDDNLLLHDLAATALGQAIRKLQKMRANEGKVLKKDLSERFNLLKKDLRGLKDYAPAVSKEYREKLTKRLQDAGIDPEKDDASIAKEVAVFADRCDITEEITRLGSHIDQALMLMKSPDGPVGRTLDFIAQEMYREINTIGSKSSHYEIAQLVVGFKAELERVREQVQNIE